jgi:two-component system, chemotaxis family, sensor kinase CheA
MGQDTDIDVTELTALFQVESEELLAGADEALVALENDPGNADLLRGVLRAAHTIKGNAAALGLPSLVESAHGLEDLLTEATGQGRRITPSVISELLESVDLLRGKVANAGQPEGDAQKSGSAMPPRAQTRSLRVEVDKLDRLLDLVGEIAIARGRLTEMLATFCAQGPAELALALQEAHQEADQHYRDLQAELMRVRMVPIGPAFRHQIRAVRDAATLLGKRVDLHLEGEDVELDTRVVDEIRDPLTHLIRNAVDHGIESPEQRSKSGKSPTGRITLRASHDAGSIVIEVCDDGAGMSRDRILERARTQGLVGPAESLPDPELFRLIFEPGFSTAAAVTELSGRGIGLDVVKRNVEGLRGSLVVKSVPGQGTTLTLRIPLTLAIIDGLVVGAGGETYVIPMEAVVECLECEADRSGSARLDLAAGSSLGVISVRGAALPYLGLRDLFTPVMGASDDRRGDDRGGFVVVQHAGGQAGLKVDALYGESQAVIKPLGHLFKNLRGISGSTILGNGRVALILDVPGLIDVAKGRTAEAGKV